MIENERAVNISNIIFDQLNMAHWWKWPVPLRMFISEISDANERLMPRHNISCWCNGRGSFTKDTIRKSKTGIYKNIYKRPFGAVWPSVSEHFSINGKTTFLGPNKHKERRGQRPWISQCIKVDICRVQCEHCSKSWWFFLPDMWALVQDKMGSNGKWIF